MADINSEVQYKTCPTIAYQMSSVCVPVTISPFAKAGVTYQVLRNASCYGRQAHLRRY